MPLAWLELVLVRNSHALAHVVGMLRQRAVGVESLHYEHDVVRLAVLFDKPRQLASQLERLIDVRELRLLRGRTQELSIPRMRTTYVVSRRPLPPEAAN